MTPDEWGWKLDHVELAKSLVAVGDSRVGWGFAERTLKGCGAIRGGVNAGLPAAGVARLVRSILARQEDAPPGAMLIHYSPGGFYYFTGLGPHGPKAKRQDVLDDELGNWIGQRLVTHDFSALSLFSALRGDLRKQGRPSAYWVSRHEWPEGFDNAELVVVGGPRPMDAAEYELEFYRDIIGFLLAHPEQLRSRHDDVIDAIALARRAGWRLALVRFPVGPRMLALDGSLPERYQPLALARELDLPLADYAIDSRAAAMSTIDESHLTPSSAIAVTALLSDDLPRLFPDERGCARQQWSRP